MAGKLKKMTDDGIREAMRMYEGGLSFGDIAPHFGVTRNALWDLLRRRGLKTRPRERFGAENTFYRGGANDTERAHNMVEMAVLRGRLLRASACEVCGGTGEFKDGRTAIQAHHDDYNKPLSVRWLCQPCHHEWHRHNVPVPLARPSQKSDAPATRPDGTSDHDAQLGLFALAPTPPAPPTPPASSGTPDDSLPW